MIKPSKTTQITQTSIYKNASIIACAAGSVTAALTYYDDKKAKGRDKAMQHAVLQGTLNALKEGATYIFTTPKNKAQINMVVQYSGNNALHFLKGFSMTTLKLSAKIAFNSANDIRKWYKGETDNKECLQSIKKNAGSVIGGFVVARGFSLACGAVMPGVGVLAGGIVGAYLGEYIGRKIAEKIDCDGSYL